MLAALALLGLAATPALAISMQLILPNPNVWTQMSYTVTVPATSPANGTQGPIYFLGALQGSGGHGMLAPTLQWDEKPGNGFVNPNVTFSKAWYTALWMECADDASDCEPVTSEGLYADLGVQIRSTATYDNGFWTQKAEVISGGGRGVSVNQTISTALSFDTQNSNTNSFLIESFVPESSAWNFNVTFTDISLTAQNSTGVASLCGGATSQSDGNGFITINGFEMSSDGLTCHWDSMTLSPP
ncbi:hypothetical protein DACRYDRAFT_101689 [Dacryopinax primogenitus]|uniref:Uncharacterized protein n=1 Tax=Dacryopinax primogenitus (strain DJM 731) TaxID=1858805 RepID=M5FT80_DACPD|nr:uncharacterized protein DACRYDRAFT_101689 [Dacryopinax primogenitus]EJT98589.1 hypothetical protein DACRYDRAFT_101689 [Dacryopinax primogenitus]